MSLQAGSPGWPGSTRNGKKGQGCGCKPAGGSTKAALGGLGATAWVLALLGKGRVWCWGKGDSGGRGCEAMLGKGGLCWGGGECDLGEGSVLGGKVSAEGVALPVITDFPTVGCSPPHTLLSLALGLTSESWGDTLERPSYTPRRSPLVMGGYFPALSPPAQEPVVWLLHHG